MADFQYLRLTLTLAVTPGTSREWQCLQVVLLIFGSLQDKTIAKREASL